MLTEQVDKLIAVLEELESRYKNLLTVIKAEKQATLSSNAEIMSSVVIRKQELMATLSCLEKQRHGLLQQIAAILHLPVSKLNLSTLAKYTNNIKSVQIEHLGVSLGNLLPRVQKANDENRALIQHCLDLVQNTLGFFQHWLAPPSVYGHKGQVNGRSLSGRMLSGII